MNKQNLMPQPAQPVHRTTTGQLPPELAELSEETLSLGADAFETLSLGADALGMGVTPAGHYFCAGSCICSYDGDDAE